MINWNAYHTMLQNSSHTLLLTAHNTTGGGYASMLSMASILHKMGKKTTCVCINGAPQILNFIDTEDKIRSELLHDGDIIMQIKTTNADVERIKYTTKDDMVEVYITPKSGQFKDNDISYRIQPPSFDMIITLQIQSLRELENTFLEHTELFAKVPIINIDTSPDNEFYGSLNMVDMAYNSPTELIYESLKMQNMLTKDVCTTLIAGLYADTESLTSDTIRPNALSIASEMIQNGASLSYIIEAMYRSKSIKSLKLWGIICDTMQFDSTYHIAWSMITKAQMSSIDATKEHIMAFPYDVLQYINGLDIGVIMLESDSKSTCIIYGTMRKKMLKRLNDIELSYTITPYYYTIEADIPMYELWDIVLHELLLLQQNEHNIPIIRQLRSDELVPIIPSKTQNNTVSKPINTDITVPKNIPFEIEKM